MVKVVVNINPIPKARARTVVRNGRVRTYTPRTTQDAELCVRAAVMEKRVRFPADVPLFVRMLFVIRRPKSAKKRAWPIVRPDLDNYEKLVLDACTGHLWKDDAQICWVEQQKVYGSPPRIEIEVGQMNALPGYER